MSSPSILSEYRDIEAHHRDIQLIANRTYAREQKVSRRLVVARSAIRETITATASRLGLHPTHVAVCDGYHVAVMADGGEILTYRVSMIAPNPDASPARDQDDAAGHAAYCCGCTPKEAGVPDEELANAAAYEALHDVLGKGVADAWASGLKPLGEPIVGHPMAAHAVADLADDEGQVPAHAVASMQMAASNWEVE